VTCSGRKPPSLFMLLDGPASVLPP
jgi:hypothetical protein